MYRFGFENLGINMLPIATQRSISRAFPFSATTLRVDNATSGRYTHRTFTVHCVHEKNWALWRFANFSMQGFEQQETSILQLGLFEKTLLG